MTCEEVERDELVEHYVLGRLSADQQEAFEDHYFACARCLDRVRILEETRGELVVQAAGVRPNWPRRASVALAAAAVLFLAVRAGRDVWRDPDTSTSSTPSASRDVVLPPPVTTQPPRDVSRLGAFDLPPYRPPRLRASDTEAQRIFRDAMVPYTAGRCDSAMPALRRALAQDAALLPASFYLAVCELQTGRAEAAVEQLQRIVAAGESPYLEDAYFFLAKARIRQGDTAAALQALERVVALRGDRREEARRLLDELR